MYFYQVVLDAVLDECPSLAFVAIGHLVTGGPLHAAQGQRVHVATLGNHAPDEARPQ